jgi:hypothetical protein
MRNYGFDYLVEKVQILNEMARFSPFWRNEFPDFENLYLQVQGIMKKHPKAPPSPTLGHRRLEYVTKSLFNFLSADDLKKIGINKGVGFTQSVQDLAIRPLTPEERIGSRKTRAYTPEYAKFAPKNADNTQLQQEFMLRLMVKAYPKNALSPQFAKKLLDQKNIYDYADKNFTTKGYSSNFASGMTAKKEKMLDMSMGEAYEIQNKAKSIIQKLKSNKKLPKGITASIYSADTNFVQPEPDVDDNTPLTIFRDTLKQLISYKQEISNLNKDNDEEMRGVNLDVQENIKYERDLLKNTPQATFNEVLKNIEARIESNQDITDEKIQKFIINVMGNAGGVVLKYYKRNLKTSSYSNEAEMLLKKDRYQSVYDTLDDGLLDDLVNEGIITDEESEIISKWRNILSKLKLSIVSKSSRDDEKAEKAQSREDRRMIRQGEYEKQGKNWEADKKLKEKGVKKPKIDIKDEVAGLSASEVEEKLREMMDDDDVNPDDEYYAKIDAISKYLSKLKKDNPEDEEGVMGYMTEQVNKDRHLNNIGEYKDRGFKKPINHAHWLWLNQ